MTSPHLRPCTAADVLTILNRDGVSIGADQMIRQLRGGLAFTAEVDGVVLGCVGLVMPWPGMGMVWMTLAKEVGRHGLWLTRTTRRLIEDVSRAYGLHRLEAVALMETDRHQRWLRLLGFTEERDGIARAYLPDKRAMRRFERIIEEET